MPKSICCRNYRVDVHAFPLRIINRCDVYAANKTQVTPVCPALFKFSSKMVNELELNLLS